MRRSISARRQSRWIRHWPQPGTIWRSRMRRGTAGPRSNAFSGCRRSRERSLQHGDCLPGVARLSQRPGRIRRGQPEPTHVQSGPGACAPAPRDAADLAGQPDRAPRWRVWTIDHGDNTLPQPKWFRIRPRRSVEEAGIGLDLVVQLVAQVAAFRRRADGNRAGAAAWGSSSRSSRRRSNCSRRSSSARSSAADRRRRRRTGIGSPTPAARAPRCFSNAVTTSASRRCRSRSTSATWTPIAR